MALTFRLVCPHCAQPTRAPAEQFYRWWPNDGPVEADAFVSAGIASYCPECEGLIALVVRGTDKDLRPILSEDIPKKDWDFYQGNFEVIEVVPRRLGTRLAATVPAEIKAAWPDLLEDVARHRNAAGVLTTCRGILEISLRALEADGSASTRAKRSTLDARIDRLRAAGVITATLAEWAHEIRLDGNQSAHELVGDPRKAAAYAQFLETFLDVAFGLPERILALKTATVEAPKRSRGSAVN